ncbi:predicted protein [Uncinocarpus reesii 1704]|uniref:Velvet domain-containing protein n=1 Tax=Uncinocarpus reesii (strain UAMH 1704) TaxID=336963 RepID=C4JRU6_UNCRE|nr:uncharacterized protein UREG_05185 [Uncinocarpus reesii 1704]EEP80343.1 predicted protein [Uncinocarpus reesii 1704]
MAVPYLQPMGYTGNLQSTPSSSTLPNVVATNNLVGNTSSTAAKLRDLTGERGIWFIFNDLSVRAPGEYRLKISIMDLGKALALGAAPEPGTQDESSPVIASIFTDVFRVYSAKTFPGMINTELSKCFVDQGVRIPVNYKNTAQHA